MSDNLDRRSFLKGAMAASAGTAAGLNPEEGILLTHLAKAPQEPVAQPADTATDALPKGKIGDLEISRMICGGNLIGGWAHARDLLYVSNLL